MRSEEATIEEARGLVASGIIADDTKVWAENLPSWMPVSAAKDLLGLADAAAEAVPWSYKGGADVVAHHVLFALASYVCGSNRVFPWPLAWLIIGELSTLPLNLRWVLRLPENSLW